MYTVGVSGMKLLVTIVGYVQLVKSPPYLDHFWNTDSGQNENKHQIMNVRTKWNCLIHILSSLVGQVLDVSGMKLLVTSAQYGEVVKLQLYIDYFWNTHSKMKRNSRLWMYTPNGTAWHLFGLVSSSIRCFRDEIVTRNR